METVTTKESLTLPTKTAEVFTSAQGPRVLLIDDDPDLLLLLEDFYREEGAQTHSFTTAQGALNYLTHKQDQLPDLIVCDLRLPDMSGTELIGELKQKRVNVPLIMITAHGSVDTAVEALSLGAHDYIAKPINYTELSVISKRALRLRQLELEYEGLKDRLEDIHRFGPLLGKSDKMKKIFDLVARVAPSSSNILITGESGTGKEVVARSVHERSERKDQPFIALNCSAIPEALLESELFGHKKGAFTGATVDRPGLFEEAHGGTLFLDEIGDMPFALQAKLLRVLQERKVRPVGGNSFRDVDVRIIAATHKDLPKLISEQQFREDLYYRLCVIPIHIPPLRERKEDIPMLARHFLKKYAHLSHTVVKDFTKEALGHLILNEWKGNIRELENTIERAVVLCRSAYIGVEDIQLNMEEERRKITGEFFKGLPTLEALEKDYIHYVLMQTGNKKDEASRLLGINRKTLYRKEKEYGIQVSPLS